MPFLILQGDITRLHVDAIVNAANPSLLGGGGVDGAIHRAAGPALREYCAGLGGCRTGEAKISPGFDLRAKWVIHTVGPIWYGGGRNEEALLTACYRNALALAAEKGCASVAFPLISAGAYGYPKEEALAVAVREIRAFLLSHEMDVTLTIFDRSGFRPPAALLAAVQAYLDRRLSAPRPALARREDAIPAPAPAAQPPTYAQSMPAAPAAPSAVKDAASRPRAKKLRLPRRRRDRAENAAAPDQEAARADAPSAASAAFESACFDFTGACPGGAAQVRPADELDRRLRTLDESFSQMLLRKIDEKGLTDAACYKRANVDRKLFSKIRSDVHYRPSKPTAIAFAIALELPLEEAKELLMKAGYALSRSNKFDVIIEYFISAQNYDIFQINETLFAFDQNLLGA